MAELELQLDSNIRLFVVLPIVFITFYVWVMQHFVSILLQIDMKFMLEQGKTENALPNSPFWWESSASVIKRMDFSRQNKGCSTLSNDRSWQANRSGERQCHHHVPMILIGSWIHTQRHTHLHKWMKVQTYITVLQKQKNVFISFNICQSFKLLFLS